MFCKKTPIQKVIEIRCLLLEKKRHEYLTDRSMFGRLSSDYYRSWVCIGEIVMKNLLFAVWKNSSRHEIGQFEFLIMCFPNNI